MRLHLSSTLSLRCDTEIAVGIAHGKGRQQALARNTYMWQQCATQTHDHHPEKLLKETLSI